MIKLTIGTAACRKTTIVTPQYTPAQAFKEADIDTTGAMIYLDGTNILDMNKSLMDYNIAPDGEATLIAVVKLSTAVSC